MYVKVNGEMAHLWRAVDQEGAILDWPRRLETSCD
ncbi:DDE-type integrase/transposase/recombinase [Pseudoblastomonas marina]